MHVVSFIFSDRMLSYQLISLSLSSLLSLSLSSAAIVPASSYFNVLPRHLEVFLVKVTNERWKTLSPLLSPSKRNAMKELNKEEKEKINRELLDSISNDRMLNPPLTQSPKPTTITNNTLRESLSSGNMVTADDRRHQMSSLSSRDASPTTSAGCSSHSVTPTPEVSSPATGTTGIHRPSDPVMASGADSSDTYTPRDNGRSVPTQPPTPQSSDASSSKSPVSLVGLMNIGNSCFMNSTIQCLSNTRILRAFFLSDKYRSDINKKNPLGFKGDLAQSFATIVRRLWKAEPRSYFSPRQLKNVIAARSKNFGGYQQQDSHEFMSYLLDGLHEDLNRVLEKPTTAPVESDGDNELGDACLAEKSWEVYQQRNDSYFVDHLQGQFKSTLYCPRCQKVCVYA